MNTYIRHATVELDKVVEQITAQLGAKTKTRVELLGHSVGVTSLRLRTFALKGFSCACCGLRAKLFAVETDAWAPPGTRPHLNLYGLNEAGEEVLFTHDHILARGLGGRDHISNTQTMCSPCNGEKAKLEQALVNERNKR